MAWQYIGYFEQKSSFVFSWLSTTELSDLWWWATELMKCYTQFTEFFWRKNMVPKHGKLENGEDTVSWTLAVAGRMTVTGETSSSRLVHSMWCGWMNVTQQAVVGLRLLLLSLSSADDVGVAGLAKDDAEKQYVLVVKRLTDIYGL